MEQERLSIAKTFDYKQPKLKHVIFHREVVDVVIFSSKTFVLSLLSCRPMHFA
jgi:hypothetical protein